MAQQKQLCLAYKGPETIWLRADESRLTQVFLNLFDNSIKHSPPQEAIRVEVTCLEVEDISSDAISEPCSVQIDIIDSGSGFSELDLPHVFERLYRGDASRHRLPTTSVASEASVGSSGSGLGLSIVQQIIQAHNGTVKARNHPETGGAWLQIKLPNSKSSP